jgi:dienelactone hydrolase
MRQEIIDLYDAYTHTPLERRVFLQQLAALAGSTTAAAALLPLLEAYAALDERINATVPAYEEALKAAGKRYTLYMYEHVNHAFHNDTSEARYNADAAQLAWKRTVTFFQEHLKG